MCKNCIHKPVCGKFLATGGHVINCKHHRQERRGKCMCKEFREQTEPGECHCGRFEKVEVEDG